MKQAGYVSQPSSTTSAKELALKRKANMSVASVEPMIMADYSLDAPPADPFKAVSFKLPSKSNGQ